MTKNEVIINTRKMRYSGSAMAALKGNGVEVKLRAHDCCEDNVPNSDKVTRNKITSLKWGGNDKFMRTVKLRFKKFTKIFQPTVVPVQNDSKKPLPSSGRVWLKSDQGTRPPQPAKGRHIGDYALTTKLAPWVKNVLANHEPTPEVLELVKPYAAEFHDMLEKERSSSTGLHDLDAIEVTYQQTLEVGAAILMAADATDDPVDLNVQLHASRAGGDDHFMSWGKLLTGLECDPPIIVQFPFYLMLCQSFTFEPNSVREDYVYSALTGVDWAKGQNKFSDRIAAFEKLARASVPTLDDTKVGGDRCFWRIALGYLRAMNDCENARDFKAPKQAAIIHGLDPDLVIAARALDTIGSAYMCRDGAAWLDDEGIDSLIGSALPNDVMDLHTDVFTGETRNLLRLLYPPSPNITVAMQTTATVLSSMLCEIFRGHKRARMSNREDGRIASTSPPYSFSRARHRRIFETLELYINKYPQFWEWTWEIYRMAKAQMTEAALAEPLVCGLKRATTQGQLPESTPNKFFDLWYEMVEDGSAQLAKKSPLGVSDDLATVTRDIHSLWHQELLDENKQPGWGREFDYRSDMLLGEAGKILGSRSGISEDMYKFAIAYGRLSMGLPYIAYHTVDAIIMAFEAVPPSASGSQK